MMKIQRFKSWTKGKLMEKLPKKINQLIEIRDAKKMNLAWIKILKEMRFVEQPKVLNIDMTNHCNAKCQKCTVRFLAEKGSPRGIMEPKTFDKIISDVKDLIKKPLTSLYLEGAGEAIMNPHIVDYVGKVKDSKISKVIGLGSNMLAMKPQMLENLLNAGLSSLKMSIDTLDQKEWNKAYGVAGYKKAMANIDQALEIISERGGCMVDLKVTLENPYGESEQGIIKQIKEKYIDRVSFIRVTDYHNWSGEFHDGVYERKYTCFHPSDEITILWDGQISLCCTDVIQGAFNMGNVNEMSLKDYWFSKELLEVRDVMINQQYKKIDVCNKCDRDTKGLVRFRYKGGITENTNRSDWTKI